MPRTIVLGHGWIGRAVLSRMTESPATPIDVRAVLTGPNAVAALKDVLRPDTELVVINTIGRMSGDPADLEFANAIVPQLLVEALVDSGACLVHVGSAAEYGDPGSSSPITEDATARPSGDYAVTKHAGSLAALCLPRACVLRPFNVVGPGMWHLLPISEIRSKVRAAVAGDGRVFLHDAATCRDFVSLCFVARSICCAAEGRHSGIYNVCSGTGIVFRDLVTEMGRQTQRSLAIDDGAFGGIRTVVGDPDKWARASGLREVADTASVATLVWGADSG